MFDPSKPAIDALSSLGGSDYYRKLALNMGGNSSDVWNNKIGELTRSYESGNMRDPAQANAWANQVYSAFGMPQQSLGIGAAPGGQQPAQPQYQPQPQYQQPQPQYQPQAPQQPASQIPNPYLTQQADQLAQGLTQNFNTRVLPQINSSAIASGGFGGSRQGIAQGLAAQGLNQAISQGQTNLYSNAYNTDRSLQAQQQMARDQLGLGYYQAGNNYALGLGQLGLGNKQADNSYNLGLGGLGLQNKSLDQNFYTNQRGQDLQQLGLGASLANQGNLGLVNQGQGVYNVGQTQQQAPWQIMQQYLSGLAPFTGLNQTKTESMPGGSALGGALGGAIGISQLLKLFGG